ncbi:MAG TPA: ATP phosphoribosyltransferase regulatory subunit [Methyloceanibacter sp.]|jgi:ATP phosphoribosyltransferase regulatory subunit|nr:ATP phosphoribosyltransferase regulatory subunit [Methyloceanibacter sp.]
MAAESALKFEALEAQATALLEIFRRAGYEQVAPSIIQPADIFLDQIGESIRSRTYVFTDLAGDELCLRPDLTVPVSRLYLERHPSADRPARYCYNGPAFRFQPDRRNQAHPREFRQAGIECFGEMDREGADVEIVLLAVEAVRSAGLKKFRLRFGDIALFYALLDALSLPERWRLKLSHYFWRPPVFHALLARLASGERPNGDGPVMALADRLAGLPSERAEELVGAYLEGNDLPLSGNRSLSEITARLLDHAADLRADPLPREVATVIDYYLAVSGPPQEAANRVAMIAKGAGIDLGPALYALVRRFERLEASGIDLSAGTFATEFGRDLEYYSGLVFQIEAGGERDADQIAGGGRYDGLLCHIGAPREVPAIGSAIHTERLLAAVERGS